METSLSTRIILALFGIKERYESKEEFLRSENTQDGWSVEPSISDAGWGRPTISIRVESPFGQFSLYYDEYFNLDQIQPY